jgi:tRNA threonylcarbamoyladenosine biosynthesis protein TsaB
MLVLALDTTTRQGSVALARDGATLATFAGDAAITHGERLPGDLMRLLDAHALHLGDVELFAVASGPGSFTGLRIGIATMQGLALAHGRSLVGISALDAINDSLRVLSPQPSALSPRDEVALLSPVSEAAVWMDAQRGQVFSAVYTNGDVVEEALVDKPNEILARWAQARRQPETFAGDGALAYRDLICDRLPATMIVEPVPPLAPSIARLAAAHFAHHGPTSPDAIRPVYIRRSDAELARDRKANVAAP